jgi:pimeloyl-ACP methyl ester carboxylesterase
VRSLIEAAQHAAFDDLEEAVRAAHQANPRPGIEAVRSVVRANLRQRDDGRWVWRYDAAGLGGPTGFFERAPAEDEQWALLARIDCPTLLVRGAETDTLRRETAERMTGAIPDCRLVELPASGHSVPRDNPAAFLAAVRPFFLGELV